MILHTIKLKIIKMSNRNGKSWLYTLLLDCFCCTFVSLIPPSAFVPFSVFINFRCPFQLSPRASLRKKKERIINTVNNEFLRAQSYARIINFIVREMIY